MVMEIAHKVALIFVSCVVAFLAVLMLIYRREFGQATIEVKTSFIETLKETRNYCYGKYNPKQSFSNRQSHPILSNLRHTQQINESFYHQYNEDAKPNANDNGSPRLPVVSDKRDD